MFPQETEGVPFIRNYTPNEYGTSPENWAIAQNKGGVMYFGNAAGVLEYDGVKWNIIPVLNNSIVRSIAIDSSGVIYVGAVGEFGYLIPDNKGVLTYHSLVDKLPPEEREFADVWKTFVTAEGIYFQTFDKLILYANNRLKIWKPESSFHLSYSVNGKFFINDREKGLKVLNNGDLSPHNRGSFFANMRIYSLLKYSQNQLLAVTREKGLFLLSDSSVTEFLSPVNKHLIEDQVYSSVGLNNDRFAFGTLKSGVFIINNKGEIVQQMNKQNGLQDDIVKCLGIDNQNDLWIALGRGISRAEISLPICFLNDANGIKGSIESISKKENILFVATSSGVFRLADHTFIPVTGISSQTRSFEKYQYQKDTFLFAASESGIYKINGANASLVKEGFGYFLYRSKINPQRVFIGMNDGLSSMRYESGKWINENYLNGVDKEIRSIAEDKKGNLWLGTPFEGVIKINFLKTKKADSLVTAWNAPYEILNYDTSYGLPSNKYNIPYNFENGIIFATGAGLFEFNESTYKFSPSKLLGSKFQQSQIFRFVPAGNLIWMSTVTSDSKETGFATRQPDGSYSWYTKPFGKISGSEIHAIYPDVNGVTWLGGPDGLLRYDAKVKKDFSQPFYALIRKVMIGKDTLFGGNFYERKDNMNIPILEQTEFLKPQIAYSDNSMFFYYSATSFEDEEKNLFRFYLEGFDKKWSDWSVKKEKEYTNLKEGNYTFHVKAKNIYGTESIKATYLFKILPPWYRTVWAYIIYVILFIGFVYLIIRLSVRRLVKAKNKLEQTVKERTAEVVSQKHLIEEKHKEITDSINYAERIQRSFLATKELLDQNLHEYFVFFQPKDVVSGDFYWASKLSNNLFALVTADSTGHGVPGAIMSILNITSLEIAVGQGLTDPSEILNKTRSNIIERLKKDGSAEGGKDGMDASLIVFDFSNKKITYAAANNPVWIVRDKQILEFAPDKMPVGKHDNDKVSFTPHTVDLQKGDMIYALTDGMPDQFGGPKGKKFMYKQLKELLISISGVSMAEQKETIKRSLNNWKGELEQVDDVCLIGVRF